MAIVRVANPHKRGFCHNSKIVLPYKYIYPIYRGKTDKV